ncbi:hypothetical protein NTCA1_54530 [Novosphingobium sp. TCA1]|nr:hypothetical protein NTCA1_54530 [Novosphingobium sp. TCA1]
MAVACEMKGEGMLEHLEAVALGPAPVGIRAAERLHHGIVQVAPRDSGTGGEKGSDRACRRRIIDVREIEKVAHGGLLGLSAERQITLPLPLPFSASRGLRAPGPNP